MSRRSWRRRLWVVGLPVVVLTLAATLGPATGIAPSGTGDAKHQEADNPPPVGGYFSIKPVGSWADLPGDGACAAAVHESTWEPRPDNATPNQTKPIAQNVHDAFAARPRNTSGAYDNRWDTWLLPRVDGQYTGTTDEIFQWAACKWGLPDNLLRAIADRESTWYQYEVYPTGRPVTNWGSGDLFDEGSAASGMYCDELASYGRDYQKFYGDELCPETFSIVGVMSWQAPGWGRMAGNQNGTYPFNNRSTAFAVDYLGSQLRGCYEGWEKWLGHSGQDYGPGQIWGCVGAWYAGAWHSAGANDYISKVQAAEDTHPWLLPGWQDIGPGCSPDYGCPRGPL